jgi:parallel beta-helix repeat protein
LKKLSGAFFMVILMPGLFFSGFAYSGLVQASAPVFGILVSDTVWTKADSPYTLTGAVGVASGVTLTIEPGVIVNMNHNYIQVNGTLNAKGTLIDQIRFNDGSSATSTGSGIIFTSFSNNWSEAPESGNIIENAVVNHTSIEINKASPKISNNTFNCRISTFDGSPLIINNIFKDGDGIVLYDSDALISGNVFSDTSQAIYVGGANCAPLIEKNLIVNNGYGIIVPSSSGAFSPTIRNNTIANNTDAICIAGGGTPMPIIQYNNIYGSTGYNFRLTEIKNDIDAAFNWWGTTDEEAIGQGIYDYRKDFNLGDVKFTPFLTESNPQAMPYQSLLPQCDLPSSTSEPTASPTQTPGSSSFNIESNSTVSAFYFNSSIPEITFTVNGTTGTMGYVKATISKSIMPNANNIKVYLDGNQISYECNSTSDYWVITFTYHHSSHQVAISAKTSATPMFPDWLWQVTLIIIIVILSIALGVFIYLSRSKKPQEE